MINTVTEEILKMTERCLSLNSIDYESKAKSIHNYFSSLSGCAKSQVLFNLENIDLIEDTDKQNVMMDFILILIKCNENPIKFKKCFKSILDIKENEYVDTFCEKLINILKEGIKDIGLKYNSLFSYDYPNDEGYPEIDPFDLIDSYKLLNSIIIMKQSMRLKSLRSFLSDNDDEDYTKFIRIPEEVYDVSMGRSFLPNGRKLDGLMYMFVSTQQHVLAELLKDIVTIIKDSTLECYDDLNDIFNVAYKNRHCFMDDELSIYKEISIYGIDPQTENESPEFDFLGLYDFIYAHLTSSGILENYYLSLYPETEILQDRYFEMDILNNKKFDPFEPVAIPYQIYIPDFTSTKNVETFYRVLTSILITSLCDLILTNICNGITNYSICDEDDYSYSYNNLERLLWFYSIVLLKQ